MQRSRLPLSAIVTLCLGIGGACSAMAEDVWTWSPAGPGGGGRFLGPGLSPADPKLILCTSDMGGAYRSSDGGADWQPIPQAMLRRPHYSMAQPDHQWAFSPADPRLILVGSIYGFHRSTDAGATWQPVRGPWETDPAIGARGPRIIVFDPAAPDRVVAFFDPTPSTPVARPFVSQDRGQTWSPLAALPEDGGKLINALFTTAAAKAECIVVATTAGVYRTDDAGSAWQPADTGLPDASSRLLRDFAGGAADSGSILYLTASLAREAGENIRRLYRSKDSGRSWAAIGNTGLFANPAIPSSFDLLAVAETMPAVIYATVSGGDLSSPGHPGSPTLYRSSDAGETWAPVLCQNVQDSRYNIGNSSWLTGQWGWNRPISGLDIDPGNPDRVVVTTISSVFLTENGGKTWRQIHAPSGTRESQPAGGLQVTSAWRYYIHPADPSRRFIALTDFAGWRSTDGGKTWSYATQGNPWHNNIYALALDPADPNRLWAACSTTHDIPTWNYQAGLGFYVGGVAYSADGGISWIPLGKAAGLPDKAVTDIVLDPHSPQNARRLWAAIPGWGVYRTEDGGKDWTLQKDGLAPDNLNVLRLRLASNGDLYALSTVRTSGGKPGALYVSAGGTGPWRKLFSDSSSPFLTDVTLDPHHPATLYVASLHTVATEPDKGGGVWKSTDSGASWKKIYSAPAYSVGIDPRDTAHLYISSWRNRGDGISTSPDGGQTWQRIDNYPHWQALTFTFDPQDPDLLYVTNFGGGVYLGRHTINAQPASR